MSIRCGDRDEGCGDGGSKRGTGPRLRFAQVRLEPRPAALDRRQVRRVGWQLEEPRAGLFNRLTDARGFVRPPVVHDDDVAWMQRGAEHLLDIPAKYFGIRGALDRHYGLDALAPERREPRHIRPIILGDRPDPPLSPGDVAIQAGHGEVHTRFIDAREPLGGERGDLLPVAGPRLLDALGVLLAGVERRFLRGNPRRCSTRHIVGTLTRTPVSAATPVHNSSSVASGLTPMSRWTTAWAAAPKRGFWPPACGFGAILPGVRCWRSTFSTKARLPPKMSAMVRWGPRCRSQARRIF
jgi:hypothetical protein